MDIDFLNKKLFTKDLNIWLAFFKPIPLTKYLKELLYIINGKPVFLKCGERAGIESKLQCLSQSIRYPGVATDERFSLPIANTSHSSLTNSNLG